MVEAILEGPPGGAAPPVLSRSLPLLGHVLELRRSPIELFWRLRRECGEIGELNFAGNRVVLLTGEEAQEAFFRADEGELDALLFSAEAGSAWTLIHPSYTVAVPHPGVLRVPLGYATARNDRSLLDFLDAWIALKRTDRTIARLFGYWFEGKEPPTDTRRWSVARDVLGWDAAKE